MITLPNEKSELTQTGLVSKNMDCMTIQLCLQLICFSCKFIHVVSFGEISFARSNVTMIPSLSWRTLHSCQDIPISRDTSELMRCRSTQWNSSCTPPSWDKLKCKRIYHCSLAHTQVYQAMCTISHLTLIYCIVGVYVLCFTVDLVSRISQN